MAHATDPAVAPSEAEGAPATITGRILYLRRPIVGMAPSADGAGYWLVASDGGIFSFGDAVLEGSVGALTLNRPVASMEVARWPGAPPDPGHDDEGRP